MEAQFGKSGGVFHNQQRQHRQQQQPPRPAPDHIEVTNQFDILANMETQDN